MIFLHFKNIPFLLLYVYTGYSSTPQTCPELDHLAAPPVMLSLTQHMLLCTPWPHPCGLALAQSNLNTAAQHFFLNVPPLLNGFILQWLNSFRVSPCPYMASSDMSSVGPKTASENYDPLLTPFVYSPQNQK